VFVRPTTHPAGLLWAAALCATAGTACVLPVAPDFQPESNQAPFEVSSSPPSGTMVADPNQTYTVTVEDPNRFDDLYVLKIIDYPPFVQEQSRRRDPDQRANRGLGQPNVHTINHRPECLFDQISPTISDHRLMIVIADRPFLPPQQGPTPQDTILDKIEEGGKLIRFFWTFKKECR
jgi:hypothetical protein